jgi:surface antigen
MDSPNCPDNGHVAIVTAIDPEKRTIDVLESNWKGDNQVHTNTYSLDSGNIYGFFDPSKSIDDYNREGSSEGN